MLKEPKSEIWTGSGGVGWEREVGWVEVVAGQMKERRSQKEKNHKMQKGRMGEALPL